jgi:hypothetical protein
MHHVPTDLLGSSNSRLIEAFDTEGGDLVKDCTPMMDSIIRCPSCRAERLPTSLALVVRKNTLAAKRAIVATLAKRKAENVDQSDSSIPFAAIPEDTPILVKFPPHYLTVQPQAAIFSSRYS